MKSPSGLSSCIKVEEKRISRKITIPIQVYFALNSDLVARINKIKAERGNLYLKPQQLTDLRYYSLINSPLIEGCSALDCDRLSLVFSSNYLFANSQTTTVVRSTIDLSGQISQEIQRDLWQDPQFSLQVIEAHHWLISEILRQLPLESPKHATFIFWVLWLSSGILVTLTVWLLIPLPFLAKLIVNAGLLLLLKMLIKYLINYRLKQWIIHQLISGWLSNKTRKRQWGFRLLSSL